MSLSTIFLATHHPEFAFFFHFAGDDDCWSDMSGDDGIIFAEKNHV